jgi:chromosome segregation ATPase
LREAKGELSSRAEAKEAEVQALQSQLQAHNAHLDTKDEVPQQASARRSEVEGQLQALSDENVTSVVQREELRNEVEKLREVEAELSTRVLSARCGHGRTRAQTRVLCMDSPYLLRATDPCFILGYGV